MEKCPMCKRVAVISEEDVVEGQHIRYKKCSLCGDYDFENGTHDLKLLKRLNRRIRERQRATPFAQIWLESFTDV